MSNQVSCSVQSVGQSKAIDEGFRVLLRDISAERKWPEVDVEKLTEWPSVFRQSWVAIVKNAVIGGFSLLEGDPKFLPIFLDCPSLSLPEMPAAEVSICGIHKDYRGLDSSPYVFACLYGTLYWYLVENDVRYVYALLDRGISALYKRKLGMDFVRIGEDFLKWDEVVFPARLDIFSAGDVVRKTKPEIWQIFLQHKPHEVQSQSA